MTVINPGGTGGLTSNPQARAVMTSNQAITGTTYTTLTWAATDFNVGPMWAGGSPTRLTATAAGIYVVECGVELAAVSGTIFLLALKVNGAALPGKVAAETNAQTNFAVSGVLKLALNDYVEAIVYLTAGTNVLATTSANGVSHFSAVQVSL